MFVFIAGQEMSLLFGRGPIALTAVTRSLGTTTYPSSAISFCAASVGIAAPPSRFVTPSWSY